MLVGAISSSASGLTVLNPVSTAKSTAASSPSTVSSSTTSTTSAAPTDTSLSSSTAQSSRSGGGGGGGGSSSSSSAVEEMSETTYTTTVGGKQYSGSVDESDGEYTATVSGLAGASASGSSVTSAENNLTTRINELV